MTRNRLTRLLATGAAATISTWVMATPAQAQLFSPCLLLGSPMPPPCIKVDLKRLADTATQNAQEIQKVKGTIDTIAQAKAATQGIVSDVRGIADVSFDFSLPNVNTDMGPLLSGVKGDIAGFASQTGNAWFSGTDSTLAAGQKAKASREIIQKDANNDAFAYGMQGADEAGKANTRYAALSGKACKAKDLRGDWSANSEIKIEVLNARARQAYLLSSFLRVQTANNVMQASTSMPGGYSSGTVLQNAIRNVTATDQSDKIKLLLDVYAKAQDIFGSVQVVQMTQTAQQTLQGVIDDYEKTVALKNAKIAELGSYAQSWVNHSGKCSAQQVVDSTLAAIGNMNNQQSAVSQQSIDQLVQSGAFTSRNIDVGAMLDNDVDPRQFIGTWTDPNHYSNTQALVTSLKDDDRNGAVARCIKGDDDNQEFTNIVGGSSYENKSVPKDDPNRYVYTEGLNDLILQEAWKKVQADDAREQLAQAEGTIAEENTQQGKVVTAASATKDLEALVAQANALGQEVSDGEDEGSKARAAEILAQLQDLVGGGTALPVVDASK